MGFVAKKHSRRGLYLFAAALGLLFFYLNRRVSLNSEGTHNLGGT